MSNDTIIYILIFLSINVVIYVALLRWASRIDDIEKNLESINAKLDMLTEIAQQFQGKQSCLKIDNNSDDKDLY